MSAKKPISVQPYGSPKEGERYEYHGGFDYIRNVPPYGCLTGTDDSSLIGTVGAHAIVATRGALYLDGNVEPGAQIICTRLVHPVGAYRSDIEPVELKPGQSFEEALAKAEGIQKEALAKRDQERSKDQPIPTVTGCKESNTTELLSNPEVMAHMWRGYFF